MRLSQLIVQANMPEESELTQLPGIDQATVESLGSQGIHRLADLVRGNRDIGTLCSRMIPRNQMSKLRSVVDQLPRMELSGEVEDAPAVAEAVWQVEADADCSLQVTVTC